MIQEYIFNKLKFLQIKTLFPLPLIFLKGSISIISEKTHMNTNIQIIFPCQYVYMRRFFEKNFFQIQKKNT